MKQGQITSQIDAEPGDSVVWYFAYGSNMLASVMSGRGLNITAAYSAAVPSHMLNFDIFGIPYSEPAMASISARPQYHEKCGQQEPEQVAEIDVPAVHGVLYRLSRSDWFKLVRSEGAGTAYREIEVEVQLLQPVSLSVSVKWVRTLVARYPFRPNAAPSKRYLDIMVKGAEERDLPSQYLKFLKSIPALDSMESRARPGAQGFIAFWLFLAKYLMRWVKLQADEHGQAPEWMGGLVWLLFNLLWWYHDYIHSKIWSSGAGDRIDIMRSSEKKKGANI
ncbi:gliotoxin biosynthesis protein [Phlyctema vagabunda]|uniref:gamma-glutamylcyclotransferase n=1 Tax=Phlyctema vagabunda TaxID=108571 RepID=A0ABR4PFK4_9HELO